MPVQRVFYDSAGNPVTRLSEHGAPAPSGLYKTRAEALQASASAGKSALQTDYDVGRERGRKEFYDDPDMEMLRQRREDLSKGFEGKELGAVRGEARNQIQGQRANYLRQLAGRTGRAGIGGARAAAMQAGADKGFLEDVAGAERKLAVDQAGLIRQGTGDLQDFIFRQKYGTLGSAIGEQQAGLAERGKYAEVKANQSSGGGGTWFCTEIHKMSPWTLGQMKALKKLANIAKDVDPELANMYFDQGGELVKKMNAEGFNWLSIKPAIEEIISYIKEDRFEEAYYHYKVMTQGLTIIYWR